MFLRVEICAIARNNSKETFFPVLKGRCTQNEHPMYIKRVSCKNKIC